MQSETEFPFTSPWHSLTSSWQQTKRIFISQSDSSLLLCVLVTVSHYSSMRIVRMCFKRFKAWWSGTCGQCFVMPFTCALFSDKEFLIHTRAAQGEEWSWRLLPPTLQIMWIKCSRFTWSDTSGFTWSPQIRTTTLHFSPTAEGIKRHKMIYLWLRWSLCTCTWLYAGWQSCQLL